MSHTYDGPATVTIDGVRLEAPTLTFRDGHGEGIRGRITVNDDGVQMLLDEMLALAPPAAIVARLHPAYSVETERAIMRAILGGTPSEGGLVYPEGSRGCFHDGCDGTISVEEGGSHWCTMGAISP
jgi:hypothetical protein